MRIHAWLQKYLEYIKSFSPNATIAKTRGELLRFAPGCHEWRDSTMVDAIHIWLGGTFEPARA